MEQYIKKSSLVEKIERLKADALQKKSQCKRSGLEKIIHQIGAYNKVISLIDTLEVKEVEDSTAAGMAEEIIVNLKRVENDYHIDLTKQMEWLRNIVKKGSKL